jgi:two-component system NarL family response regulator
MVLMDIRMPGCDGITATRLIKAERPEVKIVMLTTSSEEPDLLEAIQSGANGYLLKSLEIEPFLTYLEGVARGEAAISRELTGTLLKAVSRQDEAGKPGQEPAAEPELTQRQAEILQLVAQGLSNKELGERLSVSEHTVKYHMGEILQRLHLKNRDQAVEYAIRKGLIKKN